MKKSIVLIGGGHGLSNLIKGFKDKELDLNIIVSATDDGGHSGILREEFGCFALGDLRMVLSELVNNSLFKDLLDYRFERLHGQENVSLGNLILLSLIEKYHNIDEVIGYIKDNNKIDSNVFLSCNNSLVLCAKCGGETIMHEREIGVSNKSVDSLFVNESAVCDDVMLEKIKSADIIVLSPGSLYTSVGAVLCIESIKEAILNSKAELVYVCNIMQQDGETLNYSVKDHVDVLESILGKNIDRVIVNNGSINEDVLEKYREENSAVVKCNDVNDNYEFYNIVKIIDGKIRHDSELVKKIIFNQQ